MAYRYDNMNTSADGKPYFLTTTSEADGEISHHWGIRFETLEDAQVGARVLVQAGTFYRVWINHEVGGTKRAL